MKNGAEILLEGLKLEGVDMTGINRPIIKHNYLVTDVSDLVRIIREAFFLTRTG